MKTNKMMAVVLATAMSAMSFLCQDAVTRM